MHLEKDGARAASAIAVKPVGDENKELFGIRELADEFGISTRTIRFYEDKELLAPSRVSGARVYTRRDRARLALILRAKELGSTLEEIRHYLDLYGKHGEGRTRQLEFVVRRAAQTLEKLERQRAHIDSTLKDIREIRSFCETELARRAARKRP